MIRALLSRCKHKPKKKKPEVWIDPTGVLMMYDKYDCIICSAPGMCCVSPATCPRAFAGEVR